MLCGFEFCKCLGQTEIRTGSLSTPASTAIPIPHTLPSDRLTPHKKSLFDPPSFNLHKLRQSLLPSEMPGEFKLAGASLRGSQSSFEGLCHNVKWKTAGSYFAFYRTGCGLQERQLGYLQHCVYAGGFRPPDEDAKSHFLLHTFPEPKPTAQIRSELTPGLLMASRLSQLGPASKGCSGSAVFLAATWGFLRTPKPTKPRSKASRCGPQKPPAAVRSTSCESPLTICRT